jgi:type IV pilus assembly protein PilN
MILINLLPVRHLKKRAKTRTEVFVVGAAFIVLCTVLLGATLLMSINVNQTISEVARLEAKKKSYDATLNEIKRLEKKKEQLFVKIEAIKKLKSQSQISVHLLDEIAKLTPANSIWLNSLKQTGDSIHINGVALDNTTVAEYMKKIEASPFLNAPVLASSARQTVATRHLQAFTMTMGVIINPAQKKKAEGAK